MKIIVTEVSDFLFGDGGRRVRFRDSSECLFKFCVSVYVCVWVVAEICIILIMLDDDACWF